MNVRDIRQEEAKNSFVSHVDRRTILYCCPRFGKILTTIKIIKEMEYKKILILGPRNEIYESWKNDFEKFGFQIDNNFLTFKSIKKANEEYDLVIIDEIHEMSVNQQKEFFAKFKKENVLGLSGTLTEKTKNEIYNNIGLDTCYTYSIERGVEEGIITDYKIYVHYVDLDNEELFYKTKKGTEHTEKSLFRMYEDMSRKAKVKFIFELKLISLIQNSESKRLKTIELIEKFQDKRVLVFCGVTSVADNLGIPVYHSKSKEKSIFTEFCEGRGNMLATIKMMQSGITIKPINHGIINYTSGNPEDCAQKICRFLGFEYDNPDKKAIIHIVCLNESFEKIRINSALQFFNKEKIHYDR